MKRRGEVWWINFDPSVGSEIRKQRPAVIVSNNAANKYLSRFQVVPLSNQTNKIYPGEALVNFAGSSCKAMCDQLTKVSEQRFINKAENLDPLDMKLIEAAIKTQLDIQ